jgi:hypothetical protein
MEKKEQGGGWKRGKWSERIPERNLPDDAEESMERPPRSETDESLPLKPGFVAAVVRRNQEPCCPFIGIATDLLLE